MHVYRDELGNAKFVKSKCRKVVQRIPWAWDSITGRAKRSVGIGFYPFNQERMSSWAAMDFDAHDGDAGRARTLALAALEAVRQIPDLYLILSMSGSEGWHLFLFTLEFHAIAHWTRFLKQVVSAIGAEIRPGCCEIFPDEMRAGSLPYGIRAPGTWNPKTDRFGRIFFESVGALLALKRREEESPFLYPSTNRAKSRQLNDSATFYSGEAADWQKQFAINEPGTRHDKLKRLVHAVYRQVGYEVARRNADAQYQRASFQPKATLAEHLEEFDELWEWTAQQWQSERSEKENEWLERLRTDVERDLFRILLNFSRHAATQDRPDFPFSITNVGERLGKTFQHIAKLRRRFVTVGLIAQTAPPVPNVSAGRYRWVGAIESQAILKKH